MTRHLKHFGILGMKWGTNSFRKPSSADHAEVNANKKKSIHTMSNTEMRSVINRVNLEKQYSEATKKVTSPQRKMVMEIGTAVLKPLAEKMTKGAYKIFIAYMKYRTQGTRYSGTVKIVDKLLGD